MTHTAFFVPASTAAPAGQNRRTAYHQGDVIHFFPARTNVHASRRNRIVSSGSKRIRRNQQGGGGHVSPRPRWVRSCAVIQHRCAIHNSLRRHTYSEFWPGPNFGRLCPTLVLVCYQGLLRFRAKIETQKGFTPSLGVHARLVLI